MEGQGPEAVKVKVTFPEAIVGVQVVFVVIVLENVPKGADQLLEFAEPPQAPVRLTDCPAQTV